MLTGSIQNAGSVLTTLGELLTENAPTLAIVGQGVFTIGVAFLAYKTVMCCKQVCDEETRISDGMAMSSSFRG